MKGSEVQSQILVINELILYFGRACHTYFFYVIILNATYNE